MQFRNLLTLKGLLGALALLSVVSAQAQTSNALSGQVSSAEEGLMERRPGQRQERRLEQDHYGGQQR
jgi:hypothetical protein